MEWCATEFLISVPHVLVRHRMHIFVAKILWSTTHAPQNTYIGAPQMRFSLQVQGHFHGGVVCRGHEATPLPPIGE
jgi:hypothetical protein